MKRVYLVSIISLFLIISSRTIQYSFVEQKLKIEDLMSSACVIFSYDFSIMDVF